MVTKGEKQQKNKRKQMETHEKGCFFRSKTSGEKQKEENIEGKVGKQWEKQ